MCHGGDRCPCVPQVFHELQLALCGAPQSQLDLIQVMCFIIRPGTFQHRRITSAKPCLSFLGCNAGGLQKMRGPFKLTPPKPQQVTASSVPPLLQKMRGPFKLTLPKLQQVTASSVLPLLQPRPVEDP